MTPIVITVGEPAGIGPDCIIRAWKSHPEAYRHSVIAAPSDWLQERAALIGIHLPIHAYDSLEAASAAVCSNPDIGLHCWNPLPSACAFDGVIPGQPSPHTAEAVVLCIQSAALACLHDRASALVTGPIEKAVLRSCGFNFPGHTEFLAYLAASESDNTEKSGATEKAETTEKLENFVMMLASEQIRVALLTTHLALRDVPDSLNTADTLQCLQITHHDLRQRFGLSQPRLALCALNPHAGEQGHFGHEEIDVLAPAVAQASKLGIDVQGPLSADTLFAPNVRKNYDAIICCYHDQALIPLKTLSFGEAVNVTLGLPFIRTSVDHGTALDRAGKQDVSCSSLLAAIDMAQQMNCP
ncbi:MAG: 4-hydroxythreonine-4-phosphate dehydrogenase PdxA [Mariprofundus sp.]